MSDAVTGLVRVLHILTSATWLGGVFLWSMVVAPRVLKNGPPAIRRPFAEAVFPAITNFFRVAGISALVTGFLLVGMIWGWGDYFAVFQPDGPAAAGYGASLGLGTVAAIGMAIVGFGIVWPTAKKMVTTMQSMNDPPTPAQQTEMAAIGKKIGMMSMVTVVFGTIAIVAMAWAVNVYR